MSFRWLKQYMPRSLYTRVALILVLPVIVVQIVVSVAFLQRHLEDVTKQMTLTVTREIGMIADQVATSTSQQELLARMQPFLAALRMKAAFVTSDAVPEQDERRWYDYTGRQILVSFYKRFPDTLAIDLPDSRIARIYVSSALGPLELELDRRRLSPAAPHQLIVTMVFFAALITAVAFLYMRNQLRPISRLADAAQAFGRGRAVPFHPGGATEVRVAGNAFLDMRNRIERQIEQRTMMLSGVSHDLRTPLTRMRLQLELLDPEDAQMLRQDVDEMQQMLDAFLEFSRGAAESDPEEVDPERLVRQVVEDAKRAGRPVELVECDGEGRVMLRPIAMRRALENLIGNAVRYGTRAEVSLAVTAKSLRLRVEDDGPGIPDDKRGEAIKPFSRLDPSRNQNQGGSVGLGLAIVADIARAHGGTLRLGRSGTLGGLRADIVIGR